MWLSHIILQYIRKRIGDTKHMLHVHLQVSSQLGLLFQNIFCVWIILSKMVNLLCT